MLPSIVLWVFCLSYLYAHYSTTVSQLHSVRARLLSGCLLLYHETEGCSVSFSSALLLTTFCRQAISFDPGAKPHGTQPVKVDRLSSILSSIVSVGEHEKVAQGIFENYPNTKYRDPSMRVVSEWD